MSYYSLYVHIPFCRHRCAYCDFNTYAGLDELIPSYVDALGLEAEAVAKGAASAGIPEVGAKLPIHTVFFGGGTPSLLPARQLERLILKVSSCYQLADEVEITLEANPGTVSLDYLHSIRSLGINRLSLGMQSSNPDELRLLEREHDTGDVIHAVQWARQSEFDNLNLDLIFGLPGQPMEAWQRTLRLAVNLAPDHLSLYALTLEHGTPMQKWTERGLMSEPDPDVAADMYDWAAEALEAAGYVQYEISNWARRGQGGEILSCRHNLQYWRCEPYLGLGAGAHGYARELRVANVLAPAAYIQRCKQTELQTFPRSPATASIDPISRETAMGETMMMGLRLTQEGVSNRLFLERFGCSLLEIYTSQISRLVALELLEWAGEDEDVLRLTPHGRLLGNQVFVEFI